jgi:fibronectin type 3 domain-containing protein
MQWDDVCAGASATPVCTYNVYRGPDPQALTHVVSTVAPVYHDSQVQGGQTYYYAVTSEDASGESDKSNVAGTGVPQ